MSVKNIAIFVCLLTLFPVIARSQQTQQTQTSPAAQQMLAKKKIEFTDKSFLDAVAKGDVENVGLFLQAGMKVDSADENDRTALMLAIDTGRAAVAQKLIENGADVNAVDFDSITPLMIAAGKGDVSMVQMLIKKGATVNDSDDDDNTALMAAVQANKIEVVKILIDNGADPEFTNDDDESAVTMAKDKGYKEILALLRKAKKKP